MVLSGFSCQPWSALGDGLKSQDVRSVSLGKVLEASYWLPAHSILLECVEGAGQDPEVQRIIQGFCAKTRFNIAQVCLKLHDLMPARRNRWWCLLTNPTMPKVHLRPLPSLSIPPVLGDMLPILPQWDPSHLDQLVLDLYELNKFGEFNSLFPNIVNSEEPVRAALHGCANQLTGCPCGCRQHPFSEVRLKQKGLFGALIPTGGDQKTYLGTLPNLHHMHPWEMALIHGAGPNKVWMPQ